MISGKSFADICKWVVDNRYPGRKLFHYGMAASGDWVFINGDFLHEFMRRLTSMPTKKFNIIVHNSDRPLGPAELSKIIPVAIRIYAINTTVQHPWLTTIPIGFVDRQLPFLESFVPPPGPRNNGIYIYVNVNVSTNPKARQACVDAMKDRPGVVFASNRSVPEYYEDLCLSRFVVCPEGTGIDTHRVYESLFCGATPVVLRNSLAHLYEKLPVCIVDNWCDPFYVPKGKTFNVTVSNYIK